MNIRLATEKDCAQVLLIAKEVQTYHRSNRPDIFTDIEPYSKDFYFSLLNENSTFLYVACDDNDTAIAYCIISLHNYSNIVMLNRRSILMIDDLSVKDEYKRNGIGTSLFQFINEFGKEKSVNAIELSVWHFNDEANKFFQAMGMESKSHEYELILK
jgi:ribosomal protein S18 acetylase RimI-like enzyme